MLGVDAALSSTGYAFTRGGKLVTGTIDGSKLRGSHRLHHMRTVLGKILDISQPTLVVLEDYAMSRGHKGKVFHIGELGGVYKAMFWERGIDMITVSPTLVKSGIAGHGHAEKHQISEALRTRFGLHVRQHDEADAVALMLLGEMRCGTRTLPQNKAECARLKAVFDCELTPGRAQESL